MSRAFAGTFVVGLVAWFTPGSALGQNRFEIPARSLVIGSTGNAVPVLADVDQDTYAFSVHITFDSNKISVGGVSLGGPVSALGPEYTEGTVSNASPGDIVYGVVFDLTDPITKHLSPGDDIQILVLDVDVDAASATSVTLAFQNDTAPPWRRNVMTDIDGDSVAALGLANGTLTLTSLAPEIDSFVSNSGQPGQIFFIAGRNFSQPGLAVRVEGQLATAAVVDDGTLRVTAPACSASGFADVEVCTNFGCDVATNGFEFTGGCDDERLPPVIDSFLNNSGEEGSSFFVVGRFFDLPGLTVTVGGRAPLASSVIDAQTIRVTAPSCSSVGPAEVEVCNDYGCDRDPAGFTYTSCGGGGGVGPFLRGDCNQDGESRGSPTDGIFLLTFLFIGGPVPSCLAACDMDGSGQVEGSPTDALYFFNFNFLGGPPIPVPQSCALSADPDDVALTCADPRGCL